MGCLTPKQVTQCQYPYPNHICVIKPLKPINEPYYDEEFKNNSSSVTDNQDQFRVHRDYKWKRASETDLFLQDFAPNNIIQGALKDQYLIEALKKLVSLDAIKRIFLTEKNCSCFQVCINICGEWNVIVLDNQFPYSGERPLFSQHKLNDLWVMIIEKAFAKIYGYYSKLEHSGNMYEIMKDLTGCPYILNNKGSSKEISVTETESNEPFQYDVYNVNSYLISHPLPIRKNKSQSFILEMNVPQDSKMCLTVSQSDLKLKKNAHYGQLTLIVCKQDFSEIIDSKYDQLRDITLQLKLKQGVYIIYIEVEWQQVTDYKLNVQSYGPSGIYFIEKKGDPLQILDQMIRTHSNSSIHKQQENLKYTIKQLGRYYYAYFQNLAENQIIEIDLKINKKLVVTCNPHNDFKTNFKLKPKKLEIIKFQILLENDQKHVFQIDEKFYMNVIKSLTDSELIEKCLKQDFINRNEIIKIYKYSDDQQIGFFYKNESNQKYYETKKVQLINYHCKDANENIINIEINPNEQRLIRFDINDWNDENCQFQCEDQYRFE